MKNNLDLVSHQKSKKTRKMRYCAIAYTIYDNDHRVRRYCETLVDQGWDVKVIALRGPKADKFGTLNGVQIHRIQERTFKSDTLFSYMLNYLRFFLKGGFLLSFWQIRRHFQVVHAHNIPDFLVFMALVPKIMGAKVILDIHDIVPEFFAQKFGVKMEAFPIKILKIVERASVSFANYVIAANDLWRIKVIGRDGISAENCSAILNYPSLKYYQNPRSTPPGSAETFRLVYPGTISRHHGIDIMIEAVSLSRKEIPGIQLDIYCLENRTDLITEFKKMISILKLEEHIHFKGAFTPEELGKILPNYDAGIVPKRGGIFADEAFSSKIFDFMAAGLPIIASKTKIDEYYYDESMMVFFHPGDPADLARKIVGLHQDASKQSELKAKYRTYIAENSWEAKKHLYLDVIERLTEGR